MSPTIRNTLPLAKLALALVPHNTQHTHTPQTGVAVTVVLVADYDVRQLAVASAVAGHEHESYHHQVSLSLIRPVFVYQKLPVCATQQDISPDVEAK